jgi:integrase
MSYVDKVKVGPGGIKAKYRARWRDPSGQEKSKSFDRRAEALAFLVKIDAAKGTGSYVDPSHGKTLVSDYAVTWLAGRDVRPSTAARDDSYFRSYILPHFGSTPIGAVRAADVATWRMALLAEGKAPATVGKAITLLKSMLSDAVTHGLLPANMIARVKLPKIEREEMRFATDAQLWRLADVIDPRYRALVLVGGYGGLRIGELAGLRRGDVEIGRLSVSEQVTEVGGHLDAGPPKTRAGRRYVPLPAIVSEELAAHIAANVADDPAARVFASPDGGLLSRTRFRSRVWVPAIHAAGLDGLRVHDLRHTAISLWIADGVNPKKIAARAGHTSVRFVLDTYGHLYREDDSQELERADARIALARAADTRTGHVLPMPTRSVGNK